MSDNSKLPPSAKKLRKARELGQTIKSPLLTQAIEITILTCIVLFWSPSVWVNFRILLDFSLTTGFNFPGLVARKWIVFLVSCSAILLGGISLVGILTEFLQVGFVVSFQGLARGTEKMSIASWFTRSGGNLRASWQIPVKLLAVASVALILAQKFAPLASVMTGSGGGVSGGTFRQTDSQITTRMADVLHSLGWVGFYIGALWLGLAGADYFLRRRRFFLDQGMTLEELKREHRDDSGDPHVKAQRKHLQQAFLRDVEKRVRQCRVIVVERNAPHERRREPQH